MKRILVIVIATQDYFPLGLRIVGQMYRNYTGDSELHFRFVSDLDPNEYIDIPNVEYVHMDAGLGFEKYTMRKIEEMQYVTDEYDYYLVMDADTTCRKQYDDSFFQKDFMALKHFHSSTMTKEWHPFEKRRESTAYVHIDNIKNHTYYHACLYGGTYKEMKALSDFTMDSYAKDQETGIRAICEDESYLNKYINDIRQPDYVMHYNNDLVFATGNKGVNIGTPGKLLTSILSNEQKQELLSKIKSHRGEPWAIVDGKFIGRNDPDTQS